jgi:hypothetical protein
MRVFFGWGYDGARWSYADSLGDYTTGPTGLTSLLATRLGLTVPSETLVQRIAVYRRVLARHIAAGHGTDRPWFADSFSKDPWATAREVLAWRDELVGAGWDAGAADDARPQQPRLNTLAHIERMLVDEPSWLLGAADVFRDVAAELEWLVTADLTFDLGIASVSIDHARAELPLLWQRVFDHLVSLGVEVGEASGGQPLRELRILPADSEWDAATIATHAVQAHADAPFTLLAERSTQLLDLELARYGLPTAGVREPGSGRPGAQIVAEFLAAMMVPHDVHALANLLDMPIAVHQDDQGIRRQIRLLPGTVRGAFLNALNDQPGIGGSAWLRELETLREKATAAHYELAQTFDSLIRVQPIRLEASGVATEQVIEHLTWLIKRLNALRHGLGETAQCRGLETAVAHATTVIEVLNEIGTCLSLHELYAILGDAAGQSGPVVDDERQAASAVMDVVTSPSQLGAGNAPVVWWLPFDNAPGQRAYSRSAEVKYLQSIGVEAPDPEKLAALHLQSQIQAARQRGAVTAILPASTLDGEPVGQHPLLTFLLDDVRSQYPVQDLEALADQVTRPVEAVFPADMVEPQPVRLSSRNSVKFEVAPGEQLIPTHISYSQWVKLLTHPTDWLFEYQLQIKPAARTQIPTDNRMIGLWMHAAVETLVRTYLPDDGQAVAVEVSEDDVRDVLTALIPDYASELQLPGYRRKRATLVEHGTRAIAGLFASLATTATRISGVETRFDCEVPGSRGQRGKPLQLTGLRDVDVLMTDGRVGLIDMKYTNSKTAYQDQIRTGQALQLVVYAHSVRSSQASGQAGLNHIPTAYFLLKDGNMATEFNGFGARETIVLEPSDHGAASADELWERAVTGINAFFDRLRQGVVYDFGKLLEREEWKTYEKNFNSGKASQEPRDADLYGPLQTARAEGFIPERSFRDTTYDLITGVKEL